MLDYFLFFFAGLFVKIVDDAVDEKKKKGLFVYVLPVF